MPNATRIEKVLAANSTSTSFAAIAPTTTKPAVSATIGIIQPNSRFINLIPFGTDAENETCLMRVVGWNHIRAIQGDNDSADLWIGYQIGQFTATFSAVTGVAATRINASQFIADTLVEVGATFDDNLVTVTSVPGAVLSTRAKIDISQFELVQVDFTRNSSAASANALYWHSNY